MKDTFDSNRTTNTFSTVPAAVVISDYTNNADCLGHVIRATKQGRNIYVISDAGVLTPDDIWDIINSD